jgi:uncharacterized Zn finger protein (UPF0148 family)
MIDTLLFRQDSDMLQMDCPNCGKRIESPLLVEVQLFVCPECEEIILVEDVVISSPKPSANLRSSLKSLLISARDKFRYNKFNDTDLQAKINVNDRLRRLLRREDFRLKMAYDFLVQISFCGNKRPAKLLNISSTGAAVEFFEDGQLPEHNSEAKFQLLLPGSSEPLALLARVVWVRKSENGTLSPAVTMGLQFKNIDGQASSCLWDFVVNSETSTDS